MRKAQPGPLDAPVSPGPAPGAAPAAARAGQAAAGFYLIYLPNLKRLFGCIWRTMYIRCSYASGLWPTSLLLAVEAPMKTRKTFRLSPQAVAHLQALRARTGATETALGTLALAYLHQLFTAGPAGTSAVSPAVEPQAAAPRAIEPHSASAPKPSARAHKQRRKKAKRKRR